MAAKYILAGLALVFLITALRRLIRDRWRLGPQTRTWLLIVVIFSLVSGWLFWQER